MTLLLTPAPTPLDCPRVAVHADLQGNHLTLSYHINKKSPYDWAVFNPHNCQHADFLWEKDCLECFIGIDEHAYFEVNASPNGAFALYHFESYRNPAHLPPKATKALDFQWKNIGLNQPEDGWFVSEFCFQIGLPSGFIPTTLNPTVILHPDGEPIFYAHTHANPPDFHDKAFWVDFSIHSL
ncbi:MAG: hypothetical protein Q4B88_02180 [Moraxella sp.]|nr:hypothetical protein [Moraxella sp.]